MSESLSRDRFEQCLSGLQSRSETNEGEPQSYLLAHDATLREQLEESQRLQNLAVELRDYAINNQLESQAEVVELKRVNAAYGAQLLASTNDVGRLEKALEEIAATSPKPDDYEWYDTWHDPVGVDTSNTGDWHTHGFAMGLWEQSKVARQALASATPAEGSKEKI